MSMISMSEMYGKDLSDENEKMVSTMLDCWGDLSGEGYQSGSNTMWGLIDGLQALEPRLYLKCEAIAASCVSRINRKLGNASPSKKMRQSGKWFIQGAEIGMEDETPRLFSQTEKVGQGILSRFGGFNTSALAAKMRAAVARSASQVFSGVSAGASYRISTNPSFQGSAEAGSQSPQTIQNHISIDGREFAIVTTPYIEEELAYR